MRPRDSLPALTAYLELTKPRITALVLFTAATGLWLAPVRLPVSLVLLTLGDTALVVAAASVSVPLLTFGAYLTVLLAMLLLDRPPAL
jgi:heme O synthase-like polyprenyltransferase